MPDKDTKVWYWLVGKDPDECQHDTSGKPICPNSRPYMYICKWNCWASVMKHSHWMPLPTPMEEIS